MGKDRQQELAECANKITDTMDAYGLTTEEYAPVMEAVAHAFDDKVKAYLAQFRFHKIRA